MGHVSRWLEYHNFHHEDLVGYREKLKMAWETALLVAVVAIVIFTAMALIWPNAAMTILDYFL